MSSIIRVFTLPFDGIEKKIKTFAWVKGNGKSLKVSAQWDTGASCSAISYEVVEKLGLIASGTISVLTPTGRQDRGTYLVDLKLPNDIDVPQIVVCDSEIGSQGIQLLIGMDVISKGDFAISNFNNRTIFSFRFPSCKDVNFAVEAKMQKLIGPKHGKGKRKK